MPTTNIEDNLDQGDRSFYDISSVSRLTGLSTANLRIWEKRYEVVIPRRSPSGRREYSAEDVRKLTLLKNLADRSHPIRTTAALSIEELERRLKETLRSEAPAARIAMEPGPETSKCKVMIIGEAVSTILNEPGANLKGTATVAEFESIEVAEEQSTLTQADLLILDCPALFSEMVERVQKLINKTGAMRAVVIYSFAQSQTVALMEEGVSRITAIRAPVTASELKVICNTDIALAYRPSLSDIASNQEGRVFSDEIPERHFSDHQLALLSRVSSTIACECPLHLSSLVRSLVGFERYSAECENRSMADAEIHAYLHKMTAHARATIEDTLAVLMEYEGIKLD